MNTQLHKANFLKLKPGSLLSRIGSFLVQAVLVLLLFAVFMVFSVVILQNVGLNP